MSDLAVTPSAPNHLRPRVMRRRTLARRRAEVLLDVEPETGATTSSSPGLVLPFDPLRLIDAVVRRWWLMLIAGAALAAGMFVVGYKRFETLHTARAQIIKQETASAFRQSESGEAFRPRDMTIPTFIKLMHNGNVVEAAAARLGPSGQQGGDRVVEQYEVNSRSCFFATQRK